MAQVRRVGGHQLFEQLVVLLLVVKGHTEVFLIIISLGDCLIALDNLIVRVAVEGNVTVEAIGEAFDCGGELVAVLVH